MAEFVIEPDIQLQLEIRQSVLNKNLSKQDVQAALDYMIQWNRNRPAPDL